MKRRMEQPYRRNNYRYDRNEEEQQHRTDGTNDDVITVKEDTREYTVKVLIPNQTAWSISSRNEQKISWMAEKFSSDVRLSRNDDFYPNTMDRICMIIGKKKAIKDTLEWILNLNNDNSEHSTITMLVPKTSIGYVFSRDHSVLALRERLSVDLHVPEHNPECILRELCTKISGKKENIIEIILAIAKIILYDQFSAICKNVSYEEFNIYLKRKEHNNSMGNFNKAPTIGLQQTSNWLYQQLLMQNQRQNFINQQETIEQHSYQPAIYTNQLKSFYNQNNRQQYNHRQQQQMSPFFQQQPQQQQCADFLVQNENRLVLDIQEIKEDKIQDQTIIVESEIDKINQGENENVETGNPIPSVTTVWRRASSDNWRFGNNRMPSNGQSNVEVIPGIM